LRSAKPVCLQKAGFSLGCVCFLAKVWYAASILRVLVVFRFCGKALIMFKTHLSRTVFSATLVFAMITADGAIGGQHEPAKNAVFEVGARGAGTSDVLWCGAAKYARRYLGAGWQAKIYVVRGRGGTPAKGLSTSVLFTLDPTAAGVKPLPDGVTLDPLAVGYSMSVQRANMLCSMPPPGR
jgi:hypothetical protein